MNVNSKVSMSIRNFFKKYGIPILIVFIVWLILFIINQNLKKKPQENPITNSYTPDQAIMSDNGNVPNKYRSDVKDTIDKFFNYCKNSEYQNAYNLLSADCKRYIYSDNIQNFITYVGDLYRDKVYYIQNYSNLKNANIYIYDFYIIDNLEATGGTGGYSEHKEKLAVVKEGDEFKIANQGYIGSYDYKDINEEDENMKVKVTKKEISYQKEGYYVTFTNKTDKYILISDGTYVDAVTLNLGDQLRNATNTANATMIIEPNTTKTLMFIFDKFADDGKNPTEINFNDVCIFDTYNTSLTPEFAQKLYSFNISLK